MNGFTGLRYGYGYGFGASYEYTSPLTIGGLPLVHICGGIDPQTLRPRIAKGVIAIGNIAVGIVAIGSVACGLFTVGGAAIGFLYAVGGVAVAPAVLDGTRCDAALFEAARRWLGRVSLPPNCR